LNKKAHPKDTASQPLRVVQVTVEVLTYVKPDQPRSCRKST